MLEFSLEAILSYREFTDPQSVAGEGVAFSQGVQPIEYQ